MRIKERLKFFGLSYFSDRIARSAPEFGFGTLFLALLLSFLFFFCGYMGADAAPFSTHYKHAGQYREFLSSAFSQISFGIEEHTAVAGVRVNTYTDADDAERYVKNGYNLIIDTRAANTLIEFTQVAVSGESEISYESYLSLSEKQREEYKLVTRYTDTELIITPEKTAAYTEYLDGITADGAENYNEKAAADYKKLKDGDYSGEEYSKQLYFLYVKYYHTGVGSILRGAGAPVLRDYYYRNYIAEGKAYYFYLFGDMCAGSFETDGKLPVVFGGYFINCKNMTVDAESIDGLITEVYYDTVGYSATSYFVSTMSQLPFLIFFPLILALVMWGVGKAVKGSWTATYTGCLKTVGGFIWVSALATAIITFICGFFVSARIMYSLMVWIYLILLIIRIAAFCIAGVIRRKRQLAAEEQTINNDIFGGEI